jgi:hypothetical protein
MSATRIVGIPLVVIPLLMTWIEKSIPPRQVWARKKEFQPALLVALVASLGCLSFFVHCHFHTGHWNAYMIAQYRGWKIVPNIQDNYQFNALSVPFIMSFYVAIVLCEAIVIRTKGFRSLHSRSLYYFCSWGLFFVAAAAFANGGYQSMLRYNFCAVVLALFGIAPTLRVLLKMYPGIQTPALACYMGLVFVQMMIQGHLGFRYMAFAWVA